VWKGSPEKLEARRIAARKNRILKHRMRGMKQSVPKSVDEYIAAQSEVLRPKLEQVRAAIRRAVPEAVEGIGYRIQAARKADAVFRRLQGTLFSLCRIGDVFRRARR
jgi:hypothetical protein